MRISSILLFQTILSSSRQLMFCTPSLPAITMSYLSDQISLFLVPQTISLNLNQYLHTINWNVLFEYCFGVEDCWSEFRYQIGLAFKAHVPRLRRRTKPKKRHLPFICRMLRTKSKLWKTWKCEQHIGMVTHIQKKEVPPPSLETTGLSQSHQPVAVQWSRLLTNRLCTI